MNITKKHRYAGPQGHKYVQTLPTMFAPRCVCGWHGPLVLTREQAASAHRVHVDREALDHAADVFADRASGLDAEVEK